MSFLDDIDKLKQLQVKSKKTKKRSPKSSSQKRKSSVKDPKKQKIPEYIQFKAFRDVERLIQESNFELIHITGRLRVGKTQTILNILKKEPYLYFQSGKSHNFSRFQHLICNTFSEINLHKFGSLPFFEFLQKKIKFLIVDNVDLILKGKQSLFPSEFRVFFENLFHASTTKVKVILIHRFDLSDFIQSDLTHINQITYHLNPPSLSEALKKFPKANFIDSLSKYLITGGIPKYWLSLDHSFWDSWNEDNHDLVSFWEEEIEKFLSQFFVNPSIYEQILEIIAREENSLPEIKLGTNFKSSELSQYLHNMIKRGLLKRILPVGSATKSRKGRYFITDNFLAFYFKFIFPHIHDLNGQTKSHLNMQKEFPLFAENYLSRILIDFLTISEEHSYQFLGPWWNKETYISLLGWNPDFEEMMVGRCIWDENMNIIQVLESEYQKTKVLQKFFPIQKKKFIIWSYTKTENPKKYKNWDVEYLQLENFLGKF